MAKSFSVTLQNGATAFAARVRDVADLRDAVTEMGLHRPPLTLALVGGADGLPRSDFQGLSHFFDETLAPLAQELRATVVDGGTDAGVMRLIGRARAQGGSDFPLIGVAAAGTVSLSVDGLEPQKGPELEPHHTHFFLVPGRRWGDDSPWLNRVAGLIAGGAPSVMEKDLRWIVSPNVPPSPFAAFPAA